MKLQFSPYIFKKYLTNFLQICPVVAEFFQSDGQMDRHDKANSHFS